MEARGPSQHERVRAIAVARDFLASGQLGLNESELSEVMNEAPDWVGFHMGIFKINWRFETGRSVGLTVVGDEAVGDVGPSRY